MRLFGLGVGLSALLALSGCARVRVTTAIQANGSWTRTVMFTGQDKKDLQVTPTLEDTFVIPSGAGWKSKEEKKDGDHVLTLERTLAAGASLQGDVSVKAGAGGKLRLTNEVRVTPAGPHRFEYRETIRWKGEPGEMLGDIKPADLSEIKAALPKPLGTDANARALVDKMAVLAIPMLFGPGDPLVAMGLLHPDLAARRAGQRIGGLLIQALGDQFGDQLSPAQRKEVARQLIQGLGFTKVTAPDPAAATSSKKDSGSLTPLMFIVKTPGRVVSSNGEVDELTGEVFWALFDAAATFQDVVLTAVVEVP
ncbi:MAG TPA: hypothetical protein VEV17_24400 [Bryobacteraceae bacterium]|nr:hypothetical protein [Bryobacteraceae bacterium]